MNGNSVEEEVVKKILIVKTGALGDVLRTTGLIDGLMNCNETISLSWLTSEVAYPILKNNPFIDNLYIWKNDYVEELALPNFDVIISLEENRDLCQFVLDQKPAQIIGAYMDKSSITYTQDSAPWFDMSLISNLGREQADLLKRLNKNSFSELMSEILGIKFGPPKLYFSESQRTFISKFSEENKIGKKKLIGVNTGSGSRWRHKRLPERTTELLVDAINKKTGFDVMLLGGPEEIERNSAIESNVTTSVIRPGENHSLEEFFALVSLCDALITSDSLGLHVANAFNIPSIVFFGPTSASEVDLFAGGSKVTPDLNCIRCYQPDCSRVTRCMDVITVNDLLDALTNLDWNDLPTNHP